MYGQNEDQRNECSLDIHGKLCCEEGGVKNLTIAQQFFVARTLRTTV
jgi:hypothetical protein